PSPYCLTLVILFFMSPLRPLRVLHSFPTRRSSDLHRNAFFGRGGLGGVFGFAIERFDRGGRHVVAATRSDGQPNGGQRHQNSTQDRKSTRLNSSHVKISYAVFCLKKKKDYTQIKFL